MTTTVTSAVEVRRKDDQLIDWIRGQESEIAMAAASHVRPSAIIRVAHGALRRNPKLLAAAIARPQSLLYALLDCARLGHEPDTDDYYLVPFGNEVTGIEGYKGIIERMYRAGAVSSVVAEVVRQRDLYRRQGPTTPPVHEFDEFADPEDRGPLRGAYAYAVMLDGRFSKIIPMGRAEIMKHKAKSKGSDKPDSPWQEWEEPMWMKCPLRGLEPYVPTSTEYRRVITSAGPPVPETVARVRIGNGQVTPAIAAEPEIHDAEIVEEPQDSPGPAPAQGQPAGQEPAAGPAPDRPSGRRHHAQDPAGHAGPLAPGEMIPVGTEHASAPPERPTGSALGKIGKLLTRVPLGSPEDIAAFLAWQTGRPDAKALEHLTRPEAILVTTALDDALRDAQGDGEEAASRLWLAYRDDPARAGSEAGA